MPLEPIPEYFKDQDGGDSIRTKVIELIEDEAPVVGDALNLLLAAILSDCVDEKSEAVSHLRYVQDQLNRFSRALQEYKAPEPVFEKRWRYVVELADGEIKVTNDYYPSQPDVYSGFRVLRSVQLAWTEIVVEVKPE